LQFRLPRENKCETLLEKIPKGQGVWLKWQSTCIVTTRYCSDPSTAKSKKKEEKKVSI
jgi:hypothetical protein